MAAAARSLESEPDLQATMEAAVELATSFVDGCDEAGVTIVERGGTLQTPAYTHEVALSGDLLQYELREGPCLDAVWEHPITHSADLEREPRWPSWAPRIAREHGVHSMMCLRLFTDSKTLGALNLYAKAPNAFKAADLDDGLALAAHVAVALAGAQHSAHLARALDSRTTIGQACGILMERFDLDEKAAFLVLTRVSSESEVKVSKIAREFVQTRHYDGIPDHRSPGQSERQRGAPA